MTGISRDSALTYTVGICGGQHFSYIYDQAANTTTALAYPGAITTEAFGVNANGIAVGEWIGGITHGFSYVEGRYTSVDVADAQDTFAYGSLGHNHVDNSDGE